MNGDLKHYTVTILGFPYTIVSDETHESVMNAASVVDKNMQEIARANPKLSLHVIAVLVALQLAHQDKSRQEKLHTSEVFYQSLIDKIDQCLTLYFDHQ